MSMTVIVTRNVSNRIRGFLASSMLEMAPGVYSAPQISPAVRDRIWSVLNEWFYADQDASIIMLWEDTAVAGGQNARVVGLPPVKLVDLDGLLIAHRPKE